MKLSSLHVLFLIMAYSINSFLRKGGYAVQIIHIPARPAKILHTVAILRCLCSENRSGKQRGAILQTTNQLFLIIVQRKNGSQSRDRNNVKRKSSIETSFNDPCVAKICPENSEEPFCEPLISCF